MDRGKEKIFSGSRVVKPPNVSYAIYDLRKSLIERADLDRGAFLSELRSKTGESVQFVSPPRIRWCDVIFGN